MSTRKLKTRSSLVYCQENYSCKEEKSKATVECKDCKTVQCESCDSEIHNNSRNRYHDRIKLISPDDKELCQNGKRCNEKNFADLWCEECQVGFCNTCDGLYHRQRKNGHSRKSFQNRILFEAKNKIENLSLVSNGSESPKFEFLEGDIDSNLFHSSNSEVSPTAEQSNNKSSLPHKMDNANDCQNTVAAGTARDIPQKSPGFILFNSEEELQISSEKDFIKKLGCPTDAQVKVVSIFGNTGDGKSYTLNYTFFGGQEVFKTSATQDSCTLGVWAAYDQTSDAVIIDTEGLLGVSTNSNRRTRMLLKILAVSDVIIYRTRAERLHDDLYYFLGDASKTYKDHFYKELKSRLDKLYVKSISKLGPCVIVFQETVHTDVLQKDAAEKVLREKFDELEVNIEAFKSLHYVGTRTKSSPTDFRGLECAVKGLLQDTAIRSHRSPDVIFKAIQVLNEKFSGEIERCFPASFPDQYFTCTSKCLSCGCRCSLGMNHEQDNLRHETDRNKMCRYQYQFENKIFLCKVCHEKGEKVVVVPKAASSKDPKWFALAAYAWSGYVLECRKCGVIYRSRQYWYGNENPDKTSVITEIQHVWEGENPVLQGTHNAARRLVDGLTYVSDTIASVSAKPASAVGHWVTDQIAPAYWIPNANIKHCESCKEEFTENLSIHHCRACGHGFCANCSTKKRPVPEKGWGPEPVRVCDKCFDQRNELTDSSNSEGEGMQNTLRKGAEIMGTTVATVVGYPIEALKESSRPSYWVPDDDITQCYVCKRTFGPTLRIHHCRACGQGVCSTCSNGQRPVKERGWDHPVRVCDKCFSKRVK